MNNVLKSLFSGQGAALGDTNFKKISKRDLDRELEALSQIQREHSLLVEDRMAKRAQREMVLGEKRAKEREKELGATDLNGDDITLDAAQHQALYNIVKGQDKYVETLRELNAMQDWDGNGQNGQNGGQNGPQNTTNPAELDPDDYKLALPQGIAATLAHLTQSQEGTVVGAGGNETDITNPFTHGLVMVEVLPGDDQHDDEKSEQV